MSDFWAEVGLGAGGHTAEETERLFKNLHTEYHKLKQRMHVSGVGTETGPSLRNSEELFTMYENFYCLYYPHGGSAVPSLILTELGLHR